MRTRTRYITYVSHTLGNRWQWTRPDRTPEKSLWRAVNMVGARLLEDMGLPRNFSDFGRTLRREYPEIIEEAQQYIGETREVEFLGDETPKQFRRRFHEVQYTPESDEIPEDDIEGVE